jgi:hypothetical protein
LQGTSGADAGVINSHRRALGATAATLKPGAPTAQDAAADVATEASALASTAPAPLPAITNALVNNVTDADGGVNPAAWCTKPTSYYASTAEDYSACVILARQPAGNRIPWCTAFFLQSPGSVYDIAITVGHCVSDSRGTYLIDNGNYCDLTTDSIICCAYDRSRGKGYCPTKASFKFISSRVYDSYHYFGRCSHDMAVIATDNPARYPGKWNVNNWDGNSGEGGGVASRAAAFRSCCCCCCCCKLMSGLACDVACATLQCSQRQDLKAPTTVL